MERPVVFGRIINKVSSINEAKVRVAAEAGEELGVFTALGVFVTGNPVFVIVGGIGFGLGVATDGAIELRHWYQRRRLGTRLAQSPEEAAKKLGKVR